MVSRLEMDRVVSRIVDFHQPEMVILFGSYASGNALEGSDLDLFTPIDILTYIQSEIEKDKQRKFTFIHDALKSGKALYAVK